jgi:CubicO group peptidase (beta-lactamase class C family)
VLAARIAIVVPTGLVLASLVATRARADESDSDLGAKVDTYMDAAVRHGHFSGTILIAKDGKPLVSKGYQLANRELDVPNRPETKFRLGSITKQFTAMAILILEQRGKLSVDDTIGKHIDDAPKTWEKITIHHLLTHTSGIPNFTSFPDYRKTMAQPSPPAETIKRFKDKPLDFPPGEKHAYSNSGYILLGLIIEKVAGKSYEAFLKEAIFDPLGMNDTGYDHPEIVLKNRAAGYELDGDTIHNAAFLDMTIPYAAGALFSTTGDMMIWDQALDSEVLIPRAVLDKMFKPAKGTYAYGIIVSERFGRRFMGHGGGINGFVTDFSRYPDDKVCVVVLCNMIGGQPNGVGQDLAAILFGKPYNLPRERPVAKVDPKVYDAYVGDYVLTKDLTLSITRDGDHLMMEPTSQSKVELFPESETKYFLKVVDAQVTFVKDEDGTVSRLILRQGGEDREAKRKK